MRVHVDLVIHVTLWPFMELSLRHTSFMLLQLLYAETCAVGDVQRMLE